ncbi:MAG: hypothetical protein A2W31_15405 [Planctomycetes bacterium RBG_16_64_10]|nr:MAG: hypothetical protein A2W31_15405 [Planctomycetes bacterium RBG_16_64_10]
MGERDRSGANEPNLSEVEHIKASSRYLRGTIIDSLAAPLTGSVTESDAQLLKFHQSEPDRGERRRAKQAAD